MKCPNCGKELKDGAKFCGGCGTKIESSAENACPKCGNPLKPGAKFCGKCGEKLGGETSSEIPVTEGSASTGTQGKDFAMVGQYIHWNILPGQLAVKIDENDIAAYGKVKGVNIQDGVKALFFVEGKLVAELESGSYSFAEMGAVETKKKEVVKTPVPATTEEKKAQKKGFFGNFINSISNHFRGGNRQRAQNAGLTVRISSSVPPVNIVLVRTIDFPLMFSFENVPTANLKTKVALHLLCKISNINEFYKSQLLDNKFVSFETFSKNIESIVQGVLNTALTSINCDAISHNQEVSNTILQVLQEKIGAIYPFVKFSQIISLSAENKEIENIQRMREELYVSEQELVELSRRNNFLNRMANENNQQLLAEARTAVDFDAAMAEIDQDNELNKDEREKFALMLAAQKKLREAQTENDTAAALQEFEKSGLLRAEELDNLKTQISHNAALRDLGNSQMIALATMQNEMALDKQKLEWELSIGNKRFENDIARQRMQDSYSDERRRATMDLDKEEQLTQLELLRQAQEIRQQREDAEHQRDVENQRLQMEAEKQRLDSNLETQKIYSNMTAEQIMAANPNITPEAAAAMAEKFKAEAAASANDKTADILQQQNAQMMDFMSQQMAAVRDMSMSMAGAQSGLKDQMLDERKAEINRVREDADKTQNRVVNNVNLTAQAVAGALRGSNSGVKTDNPMASGNVEAKAVPEVKKCPHCGANNDGEALFCEDCGESL